MTLPRRIVPGQVWMITRRCTQRQFLLRPDEAMNNAFLYCLIEAAVEFEVQILLSQMMSNHHHTVVFDPHGRVVEFYQRFHTHLAKCVNALRGRWENVLASEPPCLVELVGAEDVIDKLVYTATNPVKDSLVEKTHQWPGPRTVAALFTGKTLQAKRPAFLFRHDGSMPEVVEMTLAIPPELGDPKRIVARVRAGCLAVEQVAAALRAKTHRKVIGRRRVTRQSWRASPATVAPRRTLRPRVAARNKWMRIASLQVNREFFNEYTRARVRWLAGEDVVFPAGTYWLRRFANVATEPS